MDQSELTDAEREFDHLLDRLVLGDELALSDLDSDMFALGTWVLAGGRARRTPAENKIPCVPCQHGADRNEYESQR